MVQADTPILCTQLYTNYRACTKFSMGREIHAYLNLGMADHGKITRTALCSHTTKFSDVCTGANSTGTDLSTNGGRLVTSALPAVPKWVNSANLSF